MQGDNNELQTVDAEREFRTDLRTLSSGHNDLLTVADVARQLRVDPRTLSRWRGAGTGPQYVRLGRAVRYRPRDLETWLESRLARSVAQERDAVREGRVET